jgi:hypothetical protein
VNHVGGLFYCDKFLHKIYYFFISCVT